MTCELNLIDRPGACRGPGVATVFAGLVLLMLSNSASAQSISGRWIDHRDEIVEVSQSGSDYRGHYRTGSDNGRLALEVRSTGNGGYEGQRYAYADGQRVSHVTVTMGSNGLQLKHCFGPDSRPRCMTETWRREMRRPVQLPPVIRDGIRKPQPPPVIRRPELRKQRIGG
jgi:hypothetical protein